MPRIQWERLPKEKWQHLRDRAKERKISEADLFALAEWKVEDPDVPDGDWYKDFGTFKLCGTGKFPNCGLPGSAAAYSLNATVVPTATLGYLTLWPSGSAQPLVSTLNAVGDSVVANAAIVPAGAAGAVASFVTNPTHLILDTNGYFAQ